MTEIAFHFNVVEPLVYACRLLRKAIGSGARVIVTGETTALNELDTLLWTFSTTDFVPHCWFGDDAGVLAMSPIILAPTLSETHEHEVLLSLAQRVPAGFEKFQRVIELVGVDEEDRRSARIRWKHYTECGYTITRHDLGLRTSQS